MNLYFVMIDWMHLMGISKKIGQKYPDFSLMKKPRGLYKKIAVWEPQNQEKRFPEGVFFCIDPHHMFFSWISWEKRRFWYLGEEKFCIDPAGVYRLCPAKLAQGGNRGKEPRASSQACAGRKPRKGAKSQHIRHCVQAPCYLLSCYGWTATLRL